MGGASSLLLTSPWARRAAAAPTAGTAPDRAARPAGTAPPRRVRLAAGLIEPADAMPDGSPTLPRTEELKTRKVKRSVLHFL